MKGPYSDLPEVIEAVSVLFGNGSAPSTLSLALLDPSSIRAVYRRRAFETHPDRAVHSGVSVQVLEERFREVTAAYEKVMHFVRHGSRCTRTFPDARRAGARQKPGQDRKRSYPGTLRGLSPSVRYTGEVPCRRLLLGQYLYYSRSISRSTLGAALVWQKMKRPLIGQIALKWKWLAREDIGGILSMRRPGEKFCDAAERLGYLAPYQTLTLLGRQRLLQPKLGQYFIEQGFLDSAGIARAVRDLRKHNRAYDR
jgi:hypothetical protein